METLGIRAAITEAQYHLSILEVTEDDSEEPLGDIEALENPHDDVMVNFVESLGPVSQEVDDCLGFVGIVSVLHNKVNNREEGM